MNHLIYAHDNERTHLGEFTPEKVAELIRRHDRAKWDRAYAEAYPDDYLAEYVEAARAQKESE